MNIQLINPSNNNLLRAEGEHLVDVATTTTFYRKEGVLRFVPEDNYTSNFGFQWNKFQKTQIDRESKSSSQSKVRFFAATQWEQEDLSKQAVLEVGSGAGRFSQIVLDYTKATLYSVDYSNAVEANYKNNGHHGNRFHLFQASIYELPFQKESFDKVFCFGVLQHTPSFEKSVKALIESAKEGGEVIVDFYPIKGWYTKLHAKYIFRPFTKKMKHERLLNLIEKNANWMIAATQFFNTIGIGKFINRFIPICDIRHTLPKELSKKELREWVILDTFDMFSPEHDHPQTINTVVNWFKKYGMKEVWGGFVHYDKSHVVAVVKGRK